MHLRFWSGEKIGRRWLLLKDKMKEKLSSRFSFICLHGLMSVAGTGEFRMEGRCGFNSCGHLLKIFSRYKK